MNRWRPWLRKRHVFFLISAVIFVSGFVGGSAIFDAFANRHPPLDDIERAVRSAQPSEYRNFAVSFVQSVASGDRQSHGAAKVTLSVATPLTARVDFDSLAQDHGDKPVEFADALAKWSTVKDAGPLKPPEKAKPSVAFKVAKKRGDTLTCDVEYKFHKIRFGWSLIARSLVWAGMSRWEVDNVRFPPLAPEFAALIPRSSLDHGSIVVGESAGEAFLTEHVNRRREFIESVARLGAARFERTVTAAAGAEVARSLVPTGVYTVEVTSVVAATSDTPGAPGGRRFGVDVRISPRGELFRQSSEEDNRWRESPRAAGFAQARAAAADLELDVGTLPFVAPVFYEPVLGPFAGKAEIAVSGSTDRPKIESLKWIEQPALPAERLLDHTAVGAQAVFVNQAGLVYSLATYASDVDICIARVRSETAKLERRWGPNTEAWRIVERAIKAYGGKEAVAKSKSIVERVHGTRNESESLSYTFRGTTRLSFPFRYRRDYSFTPIARRALISISIGPPPSPFTQTSTLNDRGYWKLTDEVMRRDDLATADEIEKQRARTYAEHILLHLATEDAGACLLSAKGNIEKPTIVVSSSGWPDLTLTFDPAGGQLLSVSFTEANAKKPRTVEYRFQDFNTRNGITRPDTIETHLDGQRYEVRSVESRESATFDPGDFRNPYSPGRPFVGRSGISSCQLSIVSRLIGTLMLCVDDQPESIVVNSSNQKLTLPMGEHELAMVMWIPTGDPSRPYRVDSRTKRILVTKSGQLVIFVNGRGSLDCDTS